MSNNYDLAENRKEELSDLAEFIADEHFPETMVQPEIIVKRNNITYNTGNYDKYFDGILQFKNGRFHMFFNSNRIENIYSPRGRFTVAHELGHYYIDEHRIALEKNLAPSHPSFIDFSSDNIVEMEADFFASSLLMPKSRILKDIHKRKFSFALIRELANKYNISLTAALLKFMSIGNHPIMVVYMIDARIKWFRYSADFPFKYIIAESGFRVPPLTVAGDIFYNNNINANSDETVYAEEWFKLWNKEDRGRPFFEHCIYSPKYKFAMSTIWEE